VNVDLTAGRIALTGELDRRTAHHLLDAARTLRETQHPRWVLDAGKLSFCDATGLRAISACYRLALRRGSELRIVRADSRLVAALAALRLDHHLMESRPLRHDPPVIPLQRGYPLAKAFSPLAAVAGGLG
jgi:anti-anti-sigma factor